MKTATNTVNRTSATKLNLKNGLKSASTKNSTQGSKRGMLSEKAINSGLWSGASFDSILDAD